MFSSYMVDVNEEYVKTDAIFGEKHWKGELQDNFCSVPFRRFSMHMAKCMHKYC